MSHLLRDHAWPRFLTAPDGQLVQRLYEPGLTRAIRYDRCCAYFSSSVLSAAAAGFGALIERVLTGEIASRPVIRLLVNEELIEADVEALLNARAETPLIEVLLARLGSPQSALQKRRLEMLAWLTREGWLEVRVGVMRVGGGILHAKFGLFIDTAGDSVVFAGSGNESARGVLGNYEQLEISGSWSDRERTRHFRALFDGLWQNIDPAVASVPLPEAVREKLIRLAPAEPPLTEAEDTLGRQRAAMLWGYALAAPYMPQGASTSDAMAPVSLWPHQRKVVAEVAAAWPAGRLLCDEVGMGKTVEAIVALRRLLAGRGVRRALVLTPANLLPQWQGELRERGGLRVPRLDGQRTLVWPDGSREITSSLKEALQQDLLLMSRETARLEDNLPAILVAKPWDLALLDEGHAARRASQIEGEFNSPTLLLGLLRRLQATGQARSIMILSATPMQTHPWEPWDLMQVLGEGGLWLSDFQVVRQFYQALTDLERGSLSRDDALTLARTLAATPDRPPPPDALQLPPIEDATAFGQALRFLPGMLRSQAARWLRCCSPLSHRMHRNTRSTLRRYFEMGLLDRPPARREVREDVFDFATSEERHLYEAVATYIDRRFAELEVQKPGKGFVMTIYRRRAASSPFALRKSLERRAFGLRAVIAQRAYDDDVPDLDDAADFQDLLNVRLSAGLPENPAEAAGELAEIEQLIERVVALGGLDSKRDRVVEWTRRLTADGRSILIFTGYADTMAYLREALTSAFGEMVGSYSGDGGATKSSGVWEAASKEEVTTALRDGRIRILVCTDAASEGLNLQAAGALINYDMPWNPSKVEQRIGRIDRIGQELPVLPIVNLYLRGSVDQRVYQALARRCGLFETFVGPMQPVLSRALRVLMGQLPFDEDDLAVQVDEIRADPAVMQAFPEDDPIEITEAPPLISREDTEVLLDALGDAGIEVEAVTNTRHRVGDSGMQIVLTASIVADHPDAVCIDGLDARQWKLLAQLQRPGERLPLVTASAVREQFRAIACVWLQGDQLTEIRSFDDLRHRVDAWDGAEPFVVEWESAKQALADLTRRVVDEAADRSLRSRETMVERQHEAARLRLHDELGRTLICFEPESEDLNAKFFRLMAEQTATATRLREVFSRLGGYPEWEAWRVRDLGDFRSYLTPNQVQVRRTGRELDAALADPRWQVSGGFGAPGESA